eukprot:CAMPEP_0201285928 /NCGR_PEP_ID=MMETSP1317-20130820/114030_1 /ASSEMBLY_ACC=CAM_ASM_000770 /TAXON_ID=187299 /ORGANISM="Undescribed Undescribed, Strain Undescribed" /LENGTH=67 /DNA_ID=CAMNT_0047612147 /DNA_START=681 /DNA_END=880 /DNA_ORIENTATION=-
MDESLAIKRVIKVESTPRSLDMASNKVLAGLRNADILQINESDAVEVLMRGHSDGEVWGLDIDQGLP